MEDCMTLVERLTAIDGVRVDGNVCRKAIDNGEIMFNADGKQTIFTSDTFIGDSYMTTLPLSDDTIVELFSKW